MLPIKFLVCRSAATIVRWVSPAIHQISATPGGAAAMRCRLCNSGTVINDPNFIHVVTAYHDLIQRGIVIKSVAMSPVSILSAELPQVYINQLRMISDYAVIRFACVIILN